jgi:hypothetical protein
MFFSCTIIINCILLYALDSIEKFVIVGLILLTDKVKPLLVEVFPKESVTLHFKKF